MVDAAARPCDSRWQAGRVAIEGWITESVAEALFAANGTTLAEAVKRANTRGFRAEPLQSKANAKLTTTFAAPIRTTSRQCCRDQNARRVSRVLAHWITWECSRTVRRLHIQRGGRQRHGHVGDCSRSQKLHESAQETGAHDRVPSTTLEESGLLGSAYYVDNPLFRWRRLWRRSTWTLSIGGPSRESRW